MLAFFISVLLQIYKVEGINTLKKGDTMDYITQSYKKLEEIHKYILKNIKNPPKNLFDQEILEYRETLIHIKDIIEHDSFKK